MAMLGVGKTHHPLFYGRDFEKKILEQHLLLHTYSRLCLEYNLQVSYSSYKRTVLTPNFVIPLTQIIHQVVKLWIWFFSLPLKEIAQMFSKLFLFKILENTFCWWYYFSFWFANTVLTYKNQMDLQVGKFASVE